MKNVKTVRVLATAALVLAVSSQSVLAANLYSDINSHWNKSNIIKWQNNAIISGYEDGTFKPNNAITRGEFSVILSRVFQIPGANKSDKAFSDVAKDAWYAQAVYQMRQAGILGGYEDGTFLPTKNITRQEAATALAKAFEITGSSTDALDDFQDGASVDQWARSSVAALIQEGYMSGSNNSINAKNNITRAELVMLIEKMAGDVWKNGQEEKTVSGNLIVQSASSVLENIKIAGDLYLTQGIEDGDVTLNNVDVGGRLIVLGGGENSIHLKNTRIASTLVVNDSQNRVRVVVENTSSVSSTLLKSGGIIQNEGDAKAVGAITVQGSGTEALVQLKGNFNNVSLQATAPNVRLAEGTIQNLVIDGSAKQSVVAIPSGATVAKLQANAAAQISGSGVISQAVIQSNGVESSIVPKEITLADKVTMKNGDKVVSESSKTGTTETKKTETKSTGGSKGSGSSGGSTTPTNPATPDNGSTDPTPPSSGPDVPNGPTMPSYIKSWAIATVGTSNYVSVAFAEGTKTDYTFEIDGKDVTAQFTDVTDEQTVVKYELGKNQNTLTVSKKSDSTKAVFNLNK